MKKKKKLSNNEYISTLRNEPVSHTPALRQFTRTKYQAKLVTWNLAKIHPLQVLVVVSFDFLFSAQLHLKNLLFYFFSNFP